MPEADLAGVTQDGTLVLASLPHGVVGDERLRPVLGEVGANHLSIFLLLEVAQVDVVF